MKLLVEVQELMLRLHRIDLLTKLKRAQDQLSIERALAESRRRDLELSKPKDPR